MTNVDNPYANPTPTAAPMSPAEEKQWAILSHVVSIFFGAVSAAIFYFMCRDRGPFVRAHTATEWNFQLTLLIVSGVAFVLSFGSILATIVTVSNEPNASGGIGLFFVGYVLLIVVRLVGLIFGIMASIAASKGRPYRYSMAFPFTK